MAADRPAHDDGESRRILNRVAREADASAMPRPLPESDASPGEDWPERWGRRIGAVLGPLLLALAALWFAWHLAAQQPSP